MTGPNTKKHRLAALFVLGALLFDYPLLALFNHPALIGGTPVLCVYAYFAGALLIVLLARVTERT